MDFKNLNWLVIGGAAASVGVFWNQFKAVFDQITSLVFINFELGDHSGGGGTRQIMRYIWDNFRISTFGHRSYSTYHDFIRPEQTYGYIAVKTASQSMIFWKGWRPLFVSHSYTTDSGSKYSFTFIRGTFDSDKLIDDAVKYFNSMQGVGGTNNRFMVKRFHGEAPSMGKDNGGDVPYDNEVERGVPSHRSAGIKVIGYKEDEIGIPSVESPFDSLCYAKNVKEFVGYLQRWKQSREWYFKRGIPWKTGALLHGRPGTGKTSFVRAIAQELDMPIAIMDLTSMSNDELNKAWKEAMNMSPVIILFEDLDRIFDKDKNTASEGMSLKAPLTLDSLLNCMSGIDPSDGVLVMITANDVTKIDSSIGEFNEKGVSSRPGRLDIALEFTELDEACRYGIASRVLAGMSEDYIASVVRDGDGETGAQFTKRCSDIALKNYWDGLSGGSGGNQAN